MYVGCICLINKGYIFTETSFSCLHLILLVPYQFPLKKNQPESDTYLIKLYWLYNYQLIE